MIHRIFSSLPSFKELEFHSGLNVLIAQKEEGATERQTRNRAGKSSLIEIIHFLTGAKIDRKSLFRSDELGQHTFGMTFDLRGETFEVERSRLPRTGFQVRIPSDGRRTLNNKQWTTLLGEEMFDLGDYKETEVKTPTFRSLFAYFARRQSSGAFTTPDKQAVMQQTGDFQAALLYLLGLDWRITNEWDQVREREKTLRKLKEAAKDGAFRQLIGRGSDLRTRVAVAESRLKEMQQQLVEFRVLPQYAELEHEADELTRRINELSNANIIDTGAVENLEQALHSETPPAIPDLESLYAEAGISLPSLAIKRYEEVQAFHESVIRNRRDYLTGELEAAKQRILARERDKERLDLRRATIMELLKSHGALEHFSRLQAEASRREAEVESLRQRFAAAEQLEGTKNELALERNRLTLRLRREFAEQEERLTQAILAFEEISRQLYDSPGSMTIEVTSNGPKFVFPMQGSQSKGIGNMQIYCFDMMLMRLCSEQDRGPGFLIHDSHLFDGVDGRQLASALKVGAETAAALGFQYIVTLNEDDAFKEAVEGFELRDYLLPVALTDASEDGGLFGFRF
jgi:uncharacterized protein YydD (DUF2326 family)